MLAQILSISLLLTGSFLILLAAIGLIRLPDVYCRAHALGKATTLGVCFLLLALFIELGIELTGLKIFIAICFQLLTIPVSSHLLCLLAYRSNVSPYKNTNSN
ncbi:MAG: monovalent cation/H(+) antiporter subunit G [Blastochloris sp.]|jgi:multicomponent Na+:H+ antiporter subunit G|nr:monovalent cation/H(+) antiporter subunit G [Blastochloris sp.]